LRLAFCALLTTAATPSPARTVSQQMARSRIAALPRFFSFGSSRGQLIPHSRRNVNQASAMSTSAFRSNGGAAHQYMARQSMMFRSLLSRRSAKPLAAAGLAVGLCGGASVAAAGSSVEPDIVLDPFAERQFELGKSSTYIDYDKDELVAKINEYYEKGGKALVDGYAPFCKHVFVPNFTPAASAALRITPENEHLLKSAYHARTEKELPVLTRWFPRDAVEVKKAEYLDIILYSREQINKEREAMGDTSPSNVKAPWGIVSIKPTDFNYETPMQPITMMRNALGREQGGSGVELEREKYNEAVDFWSKHAPVQ